MAVTLREVAKHAGVSFKTVSNVVNDFPHVASDTRERVLASIKELGYRPNQAARNLRRGRSGFLALVVPDLANPYFSTLASLIGRAAKEQGWTVVIEETGGEAAQEQRAVDELSTRLVDGVIFSPLSSPPGLIERRIGATPMVLLGEHADDVSADRVGMDSVLAARRVTEHLLGTGARRIGFIGYPAGSRGTAAQRWRGYSLALEAAGIPLDSRLAVEIDSHGRPGGALLMKRLLERTPDIDAVLCINDLLALGALRLLHDSGLRVPQDIVIAGFDDIEDGRFANPSLTSVSPDLPLLAQEAVATLLRRIAEPASEPRQLTIPFTIAARESTAR